MNSTEDKMFSSDTRNGNDGNSDREFLKRDEIEWLGKCKTCKGEQWVCEEHPNRGWPEGDKGCAGPGMPCECNKANPPWHED